MDTARKVGQKTHVEVTSINGINLMIVITGILTIATQIVDADALMELNVNFIRDIWKDPATRALWSRIKCTLEMSTLSGKMASTLHLDAFPKKPNFFMIKMLMES